MVRAMTDSKNTIAVLGLGLLGKGFAENLLAKGHTVRVWNRTASRAAPVVEKGAIAAATPDEAVRGASRIHLVLAEDASVDAVIETLAPALGKEVFIVDHTTNLPAGVAARFTRLRAAGIRYIHAPVFMGPSNSRDATGLMLLSGPAEDEAALRPVLEKMTGKLVYLGAEPDKAAKMKITGNGLLIMLTAAMGDLFRMGAASGVSTDEILALFDQFTPTAGGMGRRALGSSTNPVSFELTMARKDVRLMIETAGKTDLTVLPAIAKAMDAAIAAGRGAEDFSTIADPKR
jgi:3-hydroxyisobutyrate dehydrogenase-like beta-hydroxyacid dehydrogenase